VGVVVPFTALPMATGQKLEARSPSPLCVFLDSVLRAERQLEVSRKDHFSVFHGEKKKEKKIPPSI